MICRWEVKTKKKRARKNRQINKSAVIVTFLKQKRWLALGDGQCLPGATPPPPFSQRLRTQLGKHCGFATKN